MVNELLEMHSQAHDGLDIRADRISRRTQGVRSGASIEDARQGVGIEKVALTST